MDAEKTLIQQALAGEEAAFAEIVRAYQDRVRAFIGRYIRDHAAVEDIAQETFIAMYHSLPKYRQDAPLITWLLGIARNHALVFLRKKARRQQRHNKLLESDILEWQADHIETQSLADVRMERQLLLLKKCMDDLPETNSAVLKAHYFDRVPLEQIAGDLGKRAGTVRMALLRIRGALRQCMEQGRDPEEATNG